MKSLLKALIVSVLLAGAAHAMMYPGNNVVSRQVAEEGIVLLRNAENALPLTKTDTVAVFGSGQIDFIKGGGGSAWVTSPYVINIPDGIANAAKTGSVKFYEPLYKEYKADKNLAVSLDKAKSIAAKANTAVLCVAHTSSEGGDRSKGKGDWLLSEEEENLLANLTKAGFKKVIVVLNTAGIIDTSWVDTYKPQGVLFCCLPGVDGGDAVASILTGKVNPSGKLSDTWAKSIDAYSSTPGFGESRFINYTEGIYVGYRYFQTFDPAGKTVRYPFGYGLSYTNFLINNAKVATQGDKVVVTAKVTNKGSRAGKEVLQVYVKAPAGKLDKPALELRGFAKTRALAKGEAQILTVTFPKAEMASYDEYGDTGNTAAWVLEAGDYQIFAGNSIANAAKNKVGSVNVAKTTVVKQLKNRMNPRDLEKVLKSDGTYRKVPTYDPERKVSGGTKTFDIASDDYTVVEAEEFVNNFGLANCEGFSYPDGKTGISLSWTNEAGAGADYKINTKKAGKYDFYFSLAGLYEPGGSFEIFVDGKKVATVSGVDPTGDWFNFRFIDPVTVELPAGQSVLGFRTVKSYGNTDRFVIVPKGKSKLFAKAEAALKPDEPLSTNKSFTFKERTQVNGQPIFWEDVLRNRSLLDAYVGQFSDKELAYMCHGHDGKVDGECGNVGSFRELGCYGLETVDGGHGVRLIQGRYTTCMPALTLVACTWNLGIVDKFSRAIGNEAAYNNVDIWLSPGLNIHRNPLCGRNFEYFSEDPLITGLFAAKFVRCAHKYGYFSMIKHFCANNCETNRSNIDTRVNDRTMREIYLRGFQRAVEEGGALYIMSSYNFINGTEMAECRNILTDILRGEWGFKGIVCTDWGNNSDITKEVNAGNNVKMPGGSEENILANLSRGNISRATLVANAKAIFNTLLMSHDIREAARK